MAGERVLLTAALPGWPRGLREDLAAAYVGLGATSFREAMEADGVQPVWVTRGRRVWLREDLDRWLEVRAGRAVAVAGPAARNPWDDLV